MRESADTQVPGLRPSRARIPNIRKHATIAFAIGAALTLLAGFGGLIAAVAGTLAQPAFALALRVLRSSDQVDASIERVTLQRDAVALLGLWGIALVFAALLIAWPLSALLQSHGLGAAVGLSAVAGVCLIGVWRTWPLWHSIEHDGGSLVAQWHALGDADTAAWRGLTAAALVALVMAGVLVLAWPGVLTASERWIVAVLSLGLWPLCHWALQRLDAPLVHAESYAGDEADTGAATFDGDPAA
ncbi:MAG: hypothetical protein H7Y19_08090, partial [Luteimonas sp.]|nr:hypothetical protein [Luteimonas sp.]